MPKKLKLAHKIVDSLHQAGHIAYFAGGWVRDLLMGNPSEDVDIATSASPEEVAALFKKTLLVGAHFGVVVVLMEGIQYEVTTFRQDINYFNGRHPEKVIPSSPKEDAMRRDFTINGMFYDPSNKQIIDYVGGEKDLMNQVIRAIGTPETRFIEDRLRMLRAIRFSSRFQFTIEPATFDAIKRHAKTLFPAVSVERVWQELYKIGKDGHFKQGLALLKETGLFSEIFPEQPNPPIKPLHYDQGALILVLIRLLNFSKIEEGYALIDRFHQSREDKKRVELYFAIETLLKTNGKNSDWAKVLAHPLSREVELHFSQACLIAEKRKQLFTHIQRIEQRKPIIHSRDLLAYGIQPGKKMGQLLDQAATLSIDEEIEDKETLLKRLNIK